MSKHVIMKQAIDTKEEIVEKEVDPFDKLPELNPDDPDGNKLKIDQWANEHGVNLKKLQEKTEKKPIPANVYPVPYYHPPK